MQYNLQCINCELPLRKLFYKHNNLHKLILSSDSDAVIFVAQNSMLDLENELFIVMLTFCAKVIQAIV